eukprot:6173521-Pleurochrysis_carterae.AAC.1
MRADCISNCLLQVSQRDETASATASATAMFEDERVDSKKISSGSKVRRMGLVRVGERRGVYGTVQAL